MLSYFRFHHIGIACQNIERTVSIVAGGYSRTETVVDPLQNVYVCLLKKDLQPFIELIAPVDEISPICRILQKTGGVSPYHICYIVPNVENALADLRGNRYMPISKPKMSNVFGRPVCFLYHKDMGLIEIIQEQ